jgi:hypothetical protein
VLPVLGATTLVVHCTDDMWARVGHGRYLAERIPGAHYREFPGRAHFFVGEEDRALDEVEECLIGDDLTGIAVHLGARVAEKAAAGEVLVSSTVKDLVAGSGLRFSERGTQVLKGIPGEWRLFAAAG